MTENQTAERRSRLFFHLLYTDHSNAYLVRTGFWVGSRSDLEFARVEPTRPFPNDRSGIAYIDEGITNFSGQYDGVRSIVSTVLCCVEFRYSVSVW